MRINNTLRQVFGLKRTKNLSILQINLKIKDENRPHYFTETRFEPIQNKV